MTTRQATPAQLNVCFFATPTAFREWLEIHHDSTMELWVAFYRKGTGRPSITWHDSVDEALCFGWIDSNRKKINEQSYKVRFTPRKLKSTWSAVNIGRVKALTEGRNDAAGRVGRIWKTIRKQRGRLFIRKSRQRKIERRGEETVSTSSDGLGILSIAAGRLSAISRVVGT